VTSVEAYANLLIGMDNDKTSAIDTGPMKLYYLTFSSIPSRKANSVQTMQMCQAFSTFSNGLTLICSKGSPDVGDIYQHYGVSDSFDVHPVPIPGIRVLDKLCYALAVVSELRKNKDEALIYSRDQFVTGLLSLLRLRNQRIVLELHAPPASRFWHLWMKRIVCRGGVSHIVAISNALADKIAELFADFPRSRIVVAHDGASEIAFLPEVIETTCHPHRKHKIGYVGSLRTGKGMEMIEQLARIMPEHEFHVVGGDDDAVRAWKNRVPLPNLIFYGFVSPSKAHQYIAQFDILLAPYQPEVLVGNDDLNISEWMSPLKIFEYMGQRKPIIASNLPVLREVLENGRNSLLAEPTDPRDWKDKILRLLEDDKLRIDIGKGAYEDFRNKYTWEKRAEFILRSINGSISIGSENETRKA
jgi:glycosyltransferase involved in cell wall biosynthesis